MHGAFTMRTPFAHAGANSAALSIGRSYPYQQPASAKAGTQSQTVVGVGYDAGALGGVFNYVSVSWRDNKLQCTKTVVQCTLTKCIDGAWPRCCRMARLTMQALAPVVTPACKKVRAPASPGTLYGSFIRLLAQVVQMKQSC